MTQGVVVSEVFAQKFVTEKDSVYQAWVREQGLDCIRGHYIPNLHTLPLKPWTRRGGYGIYINHEASNYSNDCYVCEIPPGGELKPQRQLFEELIYALDGRGSTSIWNDAGRKTTFEWKAGSLFAIPLNTWHQHFNGSGKEPARFVAVTNAPMVINLHISQFPVATYKKSHAHGPGAHVIILTGEGYSMMQPEGGSPSRYDWQEGSMIVPPDGWYHQHFNVGTTPARYLAFKYAGVGARNEQGVPLCWISKRLGGAQLDYADEPPVIRETFAAELKKRGLKPNMDSEYQAELAELPQLPVRG